MRDLYFVSGRVHVATLPRTPVKLGLILLTPLLLISCSGLPDPGPPLRPEHPSPQFERAQWLSLNGNWGFGFNAIAEESPSFGDTIRVPFPWQSAEAGVGDESGTVGWYRRKFTTPSEWASAQVWLHLDGVAGEATVSIDGAEVGSIASGFRGAALEVTEFVEHSIESELTIRVASDSLRPASGLVGTVWLEARPFAYLAAADVRSMQEGNDWVIEASLSVRGEGGSVNVAVESSDASISSVQSSVALAGGVGEVVMRLPVTAGEAWSPQSPRLYPLTIRVTGLGNETDVMRTSVALRTVERDGRHIVVNGEPAYFRGVSYAPDLPTATDDDVLRQRLEQLKALGFNLLHLGAGGAEPRLHYWANRIGLWVLGDDGSVASTDPDKLLEIRVSETGSEEERQPLLVSIGPQNSVRLPQLFRDFSNRVRRLEFAQGYVWGAGIPASFGYEAMVPNMTAADLQSDDYVGLDGTVSYAAVLGDELQIAPFVSRFGRGQERLRLQVSVRAMNDLGGEVEMFSRPRVVNANVGTVAALGDIEMALPLARGMSGTIGLELLDEAGERRAVNYASLVVRAVEEGRSPRAEHFAPRRLALRAAPGDGDEIRESDGSELIEYVYPLAPEEFAASPIRVEILAELAAHPAEAIPTVVQVLLNGREIGEFNLPDAPRGPASFIGAGTDPRYGFLAKLSLNLTAEDIVALSRTQALSLQFVPVTGGFAIFGERSGRYLIDPTIILVTENVPGSAN